MTSRTVTIIAPQSMVVSLDTDSIRRYSSATVMTVKATAIQWPSIDVKWKK